MKRHAHRKRQSGGRRSGQGSGRRSAPVQPTSSFSGPQPSRASIEMLAQQDRTDPVWLGSLIGLLGAALLVVVGGTMPMSGLGLALVLPGLVLLLRPPEWGFGKVMDRSVIALLLVLLAAFIPQFYWPDAGWRGAAADLGIDLPLSLSIQPRVSLESWLQVAGGCAWLYAVYSWPLNDRGRRWFYFSMSVLFGGFAIAALWVHASGARPSESVLLGVFGFLGQGSQAGGLLAFGGLVSFAYAMREAQSQSLGPLMGFFASGLCLAALLFTESKFGFGLYVAGLGLWYLLRVWTHRKSGRIVKVGLLIALLVFVVFIFGGGVDAGTGESRPGTHVLGAAKMAAEAPLTGVGLGNFDSIFPQYRQMEAAGVATGRPQSSLLRFAVEAGLFGLLAVGALIWAYARLWRKYRSSRGLGLRLVALMGVVLFVLHAGFNRIDQPGPVYLAILLLAVSLPRPQGRRERYGPRWRVVGALLVLIGLIWLYSVPTRIPAHTLISLEEQKRQVEEDYEQQDAQAGLGAVAEWLRLRPLDWEAYHWQGKLELLRSGDMAAAAASFRRARFVEPDLGLVPFEEGFAWLSFSSERAVAAWEEALTRGMPDELSAFTAMLEAARGQRDLLRGLASVSQMAAPLRIPYLEELSGRDLMREIEKELQESPSLRHFTREQRTRLLEHWLRAGDLQEARSFVASYSGELERVWWLESISAMKDAEFSEAIALIRGNLKEPELPERKLDARRLVQTKREFAMDSGDIRKGLLLFQFYFESGNYADALAVCDALEEEGELPLSLHYWRAECLYRIGDNIESWFAFEKYLELSR
ncbi:MAG: O-antigen ligase family protein [Opitutales bacterium]